MRYYFFIIALILSLSSCASNDRCDCTQDDAFDKMELYVSDDIVYYSGDCYIAVEQGKGIVPGPWLENGNDIWKLCQ